MGEAVDLAVERGLIEKSGAHFSLGGERIGQGRERAMEWLRANPEALQRLVDAIRSGTSAPVPGAAAVAEEVA
jgi:recombination protein RecA